MDTSGYTVSLPDLRGFADQITSLGPFYTDIGTTVEGLGAALSATPTAAPGSLALSGVLVKFRDDYFDLLSAEQNAFTRLGKGFDVLAGNLAGTADDYEKCEHQVTRRFKDLHTQGKLEQRGPVQSELRQAPPNILDGQPMADWSTRLNKGDYFKFHDPMSYMPKMHYQDDLSVVDGMLAEAESGTIIGSLDSVVEHYFGFSPAKCLCSPLLGDWQILWVMRDALSDAADAVGAVSSLLRSGTTTLAGGEWTGTAAASFGTTIDAWRTVLGGHANNLRMASALLGEVGDRIDTDATQITSSLESAVEIVVGVLTGETEASIALSLMGSAAGGNFTDAWKGGASLADAVAVAGTSTQDLCKTADAIKPPQATSA